MRDKTAPLNLPPRLMVWSKHGWGRSSRIGQALRHRRQRERQCQGSQEAECRAPVHSVIHFLSRLSVYKVSVRRELG